MPTSLCIHGHFYQPPREDPWLGAILTEASAAPMRHWNERILRESYAPLAWSRRLDSEGRIADILNCYEWISFNAGPTLLQWMRSDAPEVLERMKAGDTHSLARWGHGNAMAQIYHHIIMPLASEEDRALEIRWAIDDFRFHFGRDPEGMWLSECAVDTPTLESLAAQKIRFVILAPRQAKAIVENGNSVPVEEGSLNIGEPYTIRLPSGASIIAVFYHGRLSQSIAFEGLLRNGETFWQRIEAEASLLRSSSPGASLLTIATDGETYGHHFTFGEMALAYVLAQGYAKRDNIRLTNFAAHIAANPPTREAVIHEPSSWSCVHGVERWRSDCGCTDGGHPGWNQQWRGPLRAALDLARQAVNEHFSRAGKDCFSSPRDALLEYGRVLADPTQREAFAAAWFIGNDSRHDKAWKLLAMQEQSLASYASCAWFFDDIARIEPVNGMTFALRAMDLLLETGGPDMKPRFREVLDAALSNQADEGSGGDVFERQVLPRKDDAATLCLLAWLRLASQGKRPAPGMTLRQDWPQVSVELFPDKDLENGDQTGTARIRAGYERFGATSSWQITPPSALCVPGHPFVAVAEARIAVRPEQGPGEELTRRAGDFSRPLRDYLQTHCLESWERHSRPEFLAVAAHTASLVDTWLESQHDVPRPDYWVGFIPYLVVETMCSDSLSEKQRSQIQVLLSLHLSARAKRLAMTLVSETMMAALTKAVGKEPASGDQALVPARSMDDQALALWGRRLRLVMPDMDWWTIQNFLWDIGTHHFPSLAKELGFR